MDQIRLILRYIAVVVIRIYQKSISFDHGLFRYFYPNGFCKFYPTCSEYAAQAVDKRGLVVGSLLVMKRLVRCNPFSKGGVDEVPARKK